MLIISVNRKLCSPQSGPGDERLWLSNRASKIPLTLDASASASRGKGGRQSEGRPGRLPWCWPGRGAYHFSHVPLVRSQSHSSAWMQGRLWNRIPAWGSSQQQLSGTCTRGQQESLATGCQALPHYGFQNWPLRERWGWPYLPKITLASTALFFTITCLHFRMNYRWPPPPWF